MGHSQVISEHYWVPHKEGGRYCSSCREYRDLPNGVWLVFHKGRNRRWRCGACNVKAEARSNRAAQ